MSAVSWCRANAMLLIALLAAGITVAFVPPDKGYLGYYDARTLACDLLTQAYVPQKAQDGAFSVTGTDDRLSEALGADAAAIEEAVAGKAAKVSPQATGATWDKEVWLDYAGNVASTTFTLDDPASTVVTVVSRGGSLEAM